MKPKFLAGDFPKGTRLLDGFGCFVLLVPQAPDIRLNNNVVAVETVTEQNKQKVLGKVGWGIVGGLAFGPLGMLAGVFAGGNSKEVCIICHLADGRSFMATVAGKTHQGLLACAFANQSRIRSADATAESTPKPASFSPPKVATRVPVPNIFLAIDGEESGPFTYDQVYNKFANDELPPHTLFWKQGMVAWRNISEAI
ncbi:MAG: DUF4339 domain-containing protein [Chthoniobacter sp.]|nr:DUF4339 domain-containing protein [Chthoniobacter sp.]